MADFELFFDMTCPYCYRGHAYLKNLLEKYPRVKVAWRPVEAHPKAEEPEHKPHVDLAVMGAFYVREHSPEREFDYYERVYKAHFEERKKVDDIGVLADLAGELGLDAAAFKAALLDGTYAAALQAANDHAYEEQKVWAVPSYVCGAERLDAVSGVGVTQEQIEALIKRCF